MTTALWKKICLGFSPLMVGCGLLSGQPGAPLSIALTDGIDRLVVTQQILPLSLGFQVTGCDDFSVSAGTESQGVTHETPLTWARNDQGSFTASLPVNALNVEPKSCDSFGFPDEDTTDAELPHLRLSLRCNQDGRSAESESRPVFYSPAGFGDYSYGDYGLFPVATPGGWAALSADGLTYENPNGEGYYGFGAWGSSPLVLPAFVRETARGVYVFGGPDGAFNGQPPGTSTVRFSPEQNGYLDGSFVADRLNGLARDVTAQATSDVALSSDGQSFTELTSLDPNPRPYNLNASVVVHLDGELPTGPFAAYAGEPAVFLSVTASNALRVHRLDGTLIEELTLLGSGPIRNVAVRADGNAWVYQRGGTLYLQTPTTPAVALPLSLPETAQPVWLRDGQLVVGSSINAESVWILADGGKTAPRPVTLRFGTGVGSPVRTPLVHTILALPAGGFAMMTDTGMQMADASGEVRSGTDPLPAACQPTLTEVPVVIDSASVALATTSGVLTFTAQP